MDSSEGKSRRTPLSTKTQNVANKLQDKPKPKPLVKPSLTKPRGSDSASSSERVRGSVHQISAAHTAPVVGSAYTDDTDNDVTTDSDMMNEERNSKSKLNHLLEELSSAKKDTRSSQIVSNRPSSAREQRATSRDRHESRERGSSRNRRSRERDSSHDHGSRMRSRDRNASQDRSESYRTSRRSHSAREVPALNLYDQVSF